MSSCADEDVEEENYKEVADSNILKMGLIISSETSVTTYKTARSLNPEDHI
jgi:hypothetical protein